MAKNTILNLLEKKKYKELKEKIAYYDDLYYNKGISEISDAEYDRLYKEYEELEKGQWFHRDRLPTLPEKLSIARRLIDAWLDVTP